MPRPSIALFLAATGLLAGMAGCGQAPETKPPQTPASGQNEPGSANGMKGDHDKKENGKGQNKEKEGEGGEGGEG